MSTLTDEQVTASAEQLLDAVNAAVPVEQLAHEPADVADGYRIQAAVDRHRTDPVVGWKAGCTSAAAQAMLGVESPLAGRYRSSDVHVSPARLASADFATFPHLEVEVGLRVLEDIDEIPGDPLELASCVEAFAAMEVVASRLAAFPLIGAPQLAADNVVGAGMVVGPTLQLDVRGLRSLADVPVSLVIDGQVIASATGAEALGHPLAVLHWTAEHARSVAQPLRSGELVITGTCTGLVRARPGSEHVGRVGDAEVRVLFN